jgi:ketosteroid isomerase-like protein
MNKLIFVATLALFGCATTGTMTPNDADTSIRAISPRFADAFNRADWNTLSTFYADDAVLLPPNADIVRGSSAIGQAFGAMGGNAKMSLTPDRIVQSCDTAYEYGTYTMQMGTMNDRGKYLTVWRRMPNGDWKITADTFNTSLPPG